MVVARASQDDQSKPSFAEALASRVTQSLKNNLCGACHPQLRSHLVPGFDPRNHILTVHEWVRKIDELRDVFRCDEETTIFHSLTQLHGLTKVCALPTIKQNLSH